MKKAKRDKFALEQFIIQNELIEILGLSHDNPDKGFYLYQIDNDPSIQKRIMDMVDEIRKYFCHVNITGLLYPGKCKRAWLSIVRGVMKSRYNLEYKACRYRVKNESTGKYESVFTMKYYLVAKNSKTKNESNHTPINNSLVSSKPEKKELNLKFKEKCNKIQLKLCKKIVADIDADANVEKNDQDKFVKVEDIESQTSLKVKLIKKRMNNIAKKYYTKRPNVQRSTKQTKKLVVRADKA